MAGKHSGHGNGGWAERHGALLARADLAMAARWRSEPTSFLLLPPAAGVSASDLLKTTPGVAANRVACDRWLGVLAGRMRAGEVSPEQALLAACIYGESRRDEPEREQPASAVELARR